ARLPPRAQARAHGCGPRGGAEHPFGAHGRGDSIPALDVVRIEYHAARAFLAAALRNASVTQPTRACHSANVPWAGFVLPSNPQEIRMYIRRNAIALLSIAPLALAAACAFGQNLTHVPNAQPKIVGVTSPTVLSPELAQIVAAQGSMLVEN